jgi:hypothetical protein
VLLALISLCFLLNIFHLERQSVQKMVGGLSVFVVALLNGHPAIIFTSLFIGGLIIASEEFMAKLAIIMRSESKDLSSNVASLTTASQSEVRSKNKEEAKELVAAQASPAATPATIEKLIPKSAQAKTALLNYLQEKFANEKYQILPEQKIDEPGSATGILVDAVIVKNETTQTEIAGLIEIQYVGTMYKFDRLLTIIERRIKQLRQFFPDKPIIFYFVIEKSLEAEPKYNKFLEALIQYRQDSSDYFSLFESVYISDQEITPVTQDVSLDLLTKN